MSNHNAAPTLNPAPDIPPQEQLYVVPASNPWGEGHVQTADVGQMAKAKYNAFLGHDAGPGIDVVRQNDAAKADKANYAQMGHEMWAVPGRPAATLGRIALKGETRGGKELGVWGRIAAGIGAVALSPGALGYPITLAFRAATNANRGHKNIFKRVVPRKGEAPHELSSKAESPYQPGYVPDSKPQPKPVKPPKAEKPPKLPRRPKTEKLPRESNASEAAEPPTVPVPRRRPRPERTIPVHPDAETSPVPAPTAEAAPELSEAERRYPDPEPIRYAPNEENYDGPYGEQLRQQDQQTERLLNHARRGAARAARRVYEARQAVLAAREENAPQEEPARAPVEHVQARSDEELMLYIGEAQRQVQALPDLSDESIATLPRLVDRETYNDIITLDRARREREAEAA